MKNLFTLLLIGLFSLTLFSGVGIQEVPTEVDAVIHIRKHLSVGGNGSKIMLSEPVQGAFSQAFNCTEAVKKIANIILQDRPNGSEVFVLIENGVVVQLDICHKHDGVVLECGEAL